MKAGLYRERKAAADRRLEHPGLRYIAPAHRRRYSGKSGRRLRVAVHHGRLRAAYLGFAAQLAPHERAVWTYGRWAHFGRPAVPDPIQRTPIIRNLVMPVLPQVPA